MEIEFARLSNKMKYLIMVIEFIKGTLRNVLVNGNDVKLEC